MTHLSDFSFLARAIADFCILIWSIMHIYSIDKFEALRWKAIKRKEVKSIMTILFLLSVATLFVYDTISTRIKYSEGFIVEPLTKKIISKPSEEWSPQNKALRHIAQYVLMVFYAVENTAIFLLQNFWSYLANKVAKAQFISTWQFRINYVFVFITLFGFPCIPMIFKSDDDEITEYSSVEELREHMRKHTYEEVVPELAAASCNLLVLIYGLMAHFKFSALIRQNDKNHIAERLKYYKHMNFLLIIIVAMGASSTVTFSIDGLTEKQYLNRNKFTSDLFVGIINFSTASCWVVWLLIFYPRILPSNGKQTSDDSKISTPAVSPTSESPRKYNRLGGHGKSDSIKHIEIKIDSTTTTMNINQENYTNRNYNNNNNNPNGEYMNNYNITDYNNIRNDGYIQIPSPLIPNNKQVVSYAGSPKHYQNFV